MSLPDFHYEMALWKKGFDLVAGMDEVGRGSFAGPVVAACVAFDCDYKVPVDEFEEKGIRIDDSKKLTEKQRVLANDWILENAAVWGVGEASVAEINKGGISNATFSAFRRAVVDADFRSPSRINYLLIDAYYIPYIRNYPVGKKRGIAGSKTSIKGNNSDSNGQKHVESEEELEDIFREDSRQLAIAKGDQKSFSVSAASIVAKVYRDNLMREKSKHTKYSLYEWEKNKGYGTKQHRQAIVENGITKFHRRVFVESYLKNNDF